MTASKQNETDWLTSREIRALLHISTCELAHLREAGKLEFVRRGNAFLYAKPEGGVEALPSIACEVRPKKRKRS